MPRDVYVHIYSATLLHTDNYIQTIAYRQWPARGPGLWSGESELHGVGDRQRPIGGEPDGRHYHAAYTSGSLFDRMVSATCRIKTPIDRIRAIICIRPLITDTQTNTLNW